MDAIILTHTEAEEIAAVARELQGLESIRRLLDESGQYEVSRARLDNLSGRRTDTHSTA